MENTLSVAWKPSKTPSNCLQECRREQGMQKANLVRTRSLAKVATNLQCYYRILMDRNDAF